MHSQLLELYKHILYCYLFPPPFSLCAAYIDLLSLLSMYFQPYDGSSPVDCNQTTSRASVEEC